LPRVEPQPGPELTAALERLTKQVAKGGGIAFVGQMVGKFLNFLLQVLLTRVLGPAGYGLYALGYSVLGIGETVAKLGLQNGVVRFGAIYYGTGDKARLKGTLFLALGISFASAAVAGTVLFLLAETIARRVFNEPELTEPLRLFSFALPFYVLVSITSFSARALHRIDYDMAVSHVLRPLLTLLAVVASFLLGYRLMGAVAGFLVSAVLSAGLGLYLLHRLFPELTSKLRSRYEARTLLSYSLTVMLVGLSHLLLTRTDRIMLGILCSAEDVGIYNAAATLAIQATLFLSSFNAIFAPTIADLFHRRRMEELEALYKTTTKWIFTLTFPVVLVFVLFARPLMGLFGPGFTAGRLVLISLGIAELINAGVGSVGFMLTMTGRQGLELVNSLLLGGINVLLNLILIPKFGALGAGIATGISIAAINLVRLVEVLWLYRIHPYKVSYWKPVVAGAVASAVWLGVGNTWTPSGWSWSVGIVYFGSVYWILVVLLGLEQEDWLVLRGIVRKFRSR